MQRDLDLIRQILLTLEAHGPFAYAQAMRIPGHKDAEVSFHVRILGEAGLLHCAEANRFGKNLEHTWFPLFLTWGGYELLELMRDEAAWHEVKDDVRKLGHSLPFSMIQEILENSVRKRVGLDSN